MRPLDDPRRRDPHCHAPPAVIPVVESGIPRPAHPPSCRKAHSLGDYHYNSTRPPLFRGFVSAASASGVTCFTYAGVATFPPVVLE